LKIENSSTFWQAISEDVFDSFEWIRTAYHDLVKNHLKQNYDEKKAILEQLKYKLFCLSKKGTLLSAIGLADL
jgi:hypothetical protein